MKTSSPAERDALRSVAESRLAIGYLPPKLVHRDLTRTERELQIHQIELQIQNEHLVQAVSDNEQALARLHALHDLAPVALLTLSSTGQILECNDTAVELLGANDGDELRLRSMLTCVGKERMADLAGLLRMAVEQGCARSDDMALVGVHLMPIRVQMRLRSLVQPGQAEPVLLVAMSNVSTPYSEARHNLTQVEWTVHFIRHLDALVPHLSAFDAAACAVAAFAQSAWREPETAAALIARQRRGAAGPDDGEAHHAAG
jgi:hypothetical protein